MKIDPIYLLAPAPAPKAFSRNRAMAAIACSALAGMLAGVFGGIAIASTHSPATDPMHEWLGQLADDTSPLDELLYNHSIFLKRLESAYPGDPQLWHGVQRLATAVLNNSVLQNRKAVANMLVHTLDSNVAPPGSDPNQRDQLAAIARQ